MSLNIIYNKAIAIVESSDMMLRLKELRQQKGLSQQKLADALGVLQTAIHNYENGNYEPDTATLIKIAQFFDTSVDYLIGKIQYSGTIQMSDKETAIIAGYRKLPAD